MQVSTRRIRRVFTTTYCQDEVAMTSSGQVIEVIDKSTGKRKSSQMATKCRMRKNILKDSHFLLLFMSPKA